jgi:hypothetical protein
MNDARARQGVDERIDAEIGIHSPAPFSCALLPRAPDPITTGPLRSTRPLSFDFAGSAGKVVKKPADLSVRVASGAHPIRPAPDREPTASTGDRRMRLPGNAGSSEVSSTLTNRGEVCT